MGLTAAELVEHPAYKDKDNVIWPLNPSAKGKCSVARGRGGPFDIAYEIHGTGPIRIVWIMGLGALKWYWQRQMRDFGHNSDKYSCLIFDNRGMGESDAPLLRYSTSEMAKDTFEVLEHVGWMPEGDERAVHVLGISMGGMIAQEMACMQPKMIASLILVSTGAYLMNTVGYIQNLRDRINILIPKSIDAQLAEIKSRVNAPWLTAPDEFHSFPTNGDRFAAQELHKRSDPTHFTRKGFLCQILAVAYHHKTTAQLRELAEAVGRERVLVMHGTVDNLITFPHFGVLVEGLGKGVNTRVWEGKGHYLPFEERVEFGRAVGGFLGRMEGMG